MPLVALISLVVYFFLVSILFSMLGLGGGAVYTPLQLFVGVPFHQAATTSLLVILLGSGSASVVYYKNKKIIWRLSLFLLLFSGIGSSAGGFLSHLISERTLSLLFTITVLVIARLMLKDKSCPDALAEITCVVRLSRKVILPSGQTNMLPLAPLALIAGILSALLGIGGGALLVPIMTLVCRMPMDIAVGSSIFVVTITALLALPGHIIHGHFAAPEAFSLAGAAFLGGIIGARTAVNTEAQKLRTAFSAVLVVVGLAVFLQSFVL